MCVVGEVALLEPGAWSLGPAIGNGGGLRDLEAGTGGCDL
jgi:hypothetical protein